MLRRGPSVPGGLVVSNAPEVRLVVVVGWVFVMEGGALEPDAGVPEAPDEGAETDEGGGYLCCRRARMSKSVDLRQEDEECSRMLNRIERALSRRKKGW